MTPKIRVLFFLECNMISIMVTGGARGQITVRWVEWHTENISRVVLVHQEKGQQETHQVGLLSLFHLVTKIQQDTDFFLILKAHKYATLSLET